VHCSPDKILQLGSRIIEVWHRCYQELYAYLQPSQPESSTWMRIWSPKRWYPIECDFAVMLSPQKFTTLVVPLLKAQCQQLDHVIYHLDGPQQIRHLDPLLDLPELDGIQWIPGENHPDNTGSPRWIPLYKKVQDRGKRLVLDKVPASSIPLPEKDVLAPKAFYSRRPRTPRGQPRRFSPPAPKADDILRSGPSTALTAPAEAKLTRALDCSP